MSKEEIDAMAAAADQDAADKPDAADQDAKPDQAAVGVVIDDRSVRMALTVLYRVVGAVVAVRYKADRFDDAECQALADASANVLNEYDLVISPRTAAWIGLGMVATAVAAPRVEQARMAYAKLHEAPEAPPEAANDNEPPDDAPPQNPMQAADKEPKKAAKRPAKGKKKPNEKG